MRLSHGPLWSACRRLYVCSPQTSPYLIAGQVKLLKTTKSPLQECHNYYGATKLSYYHTSPRLNDSFKIQDEDDFNTRVLKSKKPVVVQFHATWCGPCKVLAPRMEKSVAATKEAVDLAQVDIDDNPDIAMSYSVGAVPAVMAVKDGKVVDKFVGLKDDDQVECFVAKLAKC